MDTKNISFLDDDNSLTGRGELLLTQLAVVQQWAQVQAKEIVDVAEAEDEAANGANKKAMPIGVPEKWRLTAGIGLHQWQRDCPALWLENGKRGVVKVVTGAGKTIFALHLMEHLQNEIDPELRVAIVVPTVVLLEQWFEVVRTRGNLPERCLFRLGGGHDEFMTQDTRLIFCVLNSASTSLRKLAEDAGITEHLLLVVDECHRAGSAEWSKVFDTKRAYSLGLSATPERNDAPSDGEDEAAAAADLKQEEICFDDGVLGRELGSIIYEMTIAQAIEQRLLASFDICHYGLPLNAKEQAAYTRHSREISELRRILERQNSRAKAMGGGALVGYARKMAARKDSKFSAEAASYVREVGQRKALLYRAESRLWAVRELIRSSLENTPDARIILFHESIKEVMRIYFMLLRDGFPVAVDHSKLKMSLRSSNICLFRRGEAQILVSARSLIEGFDVPAADVAIVVASSSSVRQRVQTIGRVLRKPTDGGDKHAAIHVLYMSGTTDETIYGIQHWDEVVGAERNQYFLWAPQATQHGQSDAPQAPSVPILQASPPRRPKPRELEINWDLLQQGDLYPGEYEGSEFKCDYQGNIIDTAGRFASNPQGIPEIIRQLYPGYSTFKVTPHKWGLLVRVKDGEEWHTRIAGRLKAPFAFPPNKEHLESVSLDLTALKEGMPYSGDVAEGEDYLLKPFKGMLRIKTLDERRSALFPDRAKDTKKGEDAVAVVNAAGRLSGSCGRINKIRLLTNNVLVSQISGQWIFIVRINNGLEFKE